MSNEQKNVVYEECVLCHAQTDVPIDLSVNKRENYISGIGQLCLKCFGKMKHSEAHANEPTDAQLNTIMRLCLDDEDEKGYSKPSALIQK